MRQINNELTRDKVINELRRDILSGNFSPNQELYQDKIADELGVSRMPVREALQILHNEGLVTVRPNKVATVNEISSKFISDHFDLRSLLEQEVARRVCRIGIDCEPLWELYNKAEVAIQNNNINEYNEYNRQIHQYLWHSADNIQLERILSQLWNTVSADTERPGKMASESNDEHKALITALEARDEERACDSARLHVEHGRDRLLTTLSKHQNL